jgi:hypothetical protein
LWSTYWGGSGVTSFRDIVVDSDGNQYITGSVNAPSFPISTGSEILQEFLGGSDAFLIKINSDHEPVWLTHFGGATDVSNSAAVGNDIALSVDATEDGESIYIGGRTASIDMIIEDGNGLFYSDAENECNTGSCSDAFIARFKQDGELVWSTYYGATDNNEEKIMDIALDNSGNLYAVGERSANAELLTRSGADNFSSGLGSILMFNSDNERVWANAYDVVRFNAVATDNNGKVYMCGASTSLASPVNNSDPDYTFTSSFTISDGDGYVVGFDENGAIDYSFYYGRSCLDICTDLGVDNNGNVYVTGISYQVGGGGFCNQVNTPLVVDGGFSPTNGRPESFVFKIDNYTGGNVNISRGGYFGGGGDEVDLSTGSSKISISVLPSGGFVLSGPSNSQDGNGLSPSIQAPTTQPTNYYAEDFALGTNPILEDAYLAFFDEDFNLVWSTYFGGSKQDSPNATAITNDQSRLYMVGYECTNNDLNPAVDFEHQDYDELSFFDYFQDDIIDPQNIGSLPSWCALFDISGIPLSSSALVEQLDDEITIFPNPSFDEIRIRKTDFVENVEIRIFNNIGVLVKSYSQFNLAQPIPIDHLSSGIYILELDFAGEKSTAKFVKP